MKENTYSFSAFSEHSSSGIYQSLIELNKDNKLPIFICIGSDMVLGDSLGPLVGTFLKKKKVNTYIYGTLSFPITAKEISYARTYLKQLHPSAISIAIDAAIGEPESIGLIKVLNKGFTAAISSHRGRIARIIFIPFLPFSSR